MTDYVNVDIPYTGYSLNPYGPGTQFVNTLMIISYAQEETILEYILNYTMRAIADPGPGYVYWNVINEPDFDGYQTEEDIIVNSAVIYQQWTE